MEAKFIENKIPYQKEVLVQVYYHGQLLGKFYLDFIVWDKIVIEIKTSPINKIEYIKQIKRYLEAKNMRLGLLINFAIRPLKPVRIIHPQTPLAN